ncbi:GAF and ANTAR domain-containing protein [Mycobacterium sp. Root265]|uniref:GAF and ANTAR domain-containing protein n=1 Tax=Mycobacterium sp. Root265 TaxID=1736504 RepID=UPI0009EC500A|nr:GAF and ANTAR domain-containing protein [Mycobacterium sp. Root265]
MIEHELRAAMDVQPGPSAADRLCQACVALLGVEATAISLVSRGVNIGTLGASATAARTYDEAHFTHGEGPGLDAVAQRAPVLVTDLADPSEVRWPGYTPTMLAHQIRAVFAVPIAVDGHSVGALSVFQTRPEPFTIAQVTGLMEAAKLAQRLVLDVIEQQERSEAGSGPLKDADTWTRPEVSQATGMVMAQLRLTAPDALLRIRAHAYATGRNATDVARDILERRLHLDPD